MNSKSLARLKKILRLPNSAWILKLFDQWLSSLGYRDRLADKEGNYLYAPGTIPILLVAHVDTVHKEPPSQIQVSKHGIVSAPATGLGADDRAGVWLIFEILRQGLKPHVLLCNWEETGAYGAEQAVRDLEAPDVRYIIELDRRGKDDAVFYDCENPDFTRYVETFGWRENWGSFSDISELAPAWKIAAVNLSIGYYSQHTSREYLVLSEARQAMRRVVKMLQNPPAETYQYIESSFSWRRYTGGWSDWRWNSGRELAEHYEKPQSCPFCAGDRVYKDPKNPGGHYCFDCGVEIRAHDLVDSEESEYAHFGICPNCRTETVYRNSLTDTWDCWSCKTSFDYSDLQLARKLGMVEDTHDVSECDHAHTFLVSNEAGTPYRVCTDCGERGDLWGDIGTASCKHNHQYRDHMAYMRCADCGKVLGDTKPPIPSGFTPEEFARYKSIDEELRGTKARKKTVFQPLEEDAYAEDDNELFFSHRTVAVGKQYVIQKGTGWMTLECPTCRTHFNHWSGKTWRCPHCRTHFLYQCEKLAEQEDSAKEEQA